MRLVKDSNGNAVLPKWALWTILGVGGLGSGGAAVTTFKVDAIGRRLELHEMAGAPHLATARIEEMARLTALVEVVRQELGSKADRISRVEAGQEAVVRQLDRIEKAIEELRRPK